MNPVETARDGSLAAEISVALVEVLPLMSGNRIDPDLAAEVFVLAPQPSLSA